jgi:CHAT domain-containing protein
LDDILEQGRNRPPDAAGGLIITNACLTDSTFAHPDESLTLATAFLAAGATAVIGTRWPIDDDTAAVLIHRLHHHLHLGRPPAEALRLAQLDLLTLTPDLRHGLHPHLAAIDDPRLAHPASWAGHVHHGI